MPHLSFGTKAETLANLQPHVVTARILPLIFFEVDQWAADATRVLEHIERSSLGGEPFIVRSSARDEDAQDNSQAGKYRSVHHVQLAALPHAINSVIASYGTSSHPHPGSHQILVQPMLRDVAISGVLLTMDPASGSPYFVVNYLEGPDTSVVTGGGQGVTQTVYCAKGGRGSLPPSLALLRPLAEELEALLHQRALDIEFAFTGDGTLFLLQVRCLHLAEDLGLNEQDHHQVLSQVATKMRDLSQPHPYLLGQKAIFGVMPDWNPAEMIGTRPRPLALSLYRDLITNSIWAYQRDNYGYRNLRSFPLMVHFHGLPYIDVRVCFNSFIPADLPGEIAGRLVDHYLDRLIATPEFHDKVEFEILFSCFTFDLETRLADLSRSGFTSAEIQCLSDSLKKLTNTIIHREGLWRGDLARIEDLERRQALLRTCDLDPISKIYWLAEDCKRYGTLPFAGLARAGFIAVQILDSLVKVGILSELERSAFLAGLDTISSHMTRDLHGLSRESFLAKYGHLRPGTYDILSPRYDEAPDVFFDWSNLDSSPPPSHPILGDFNLTLHQMRDIDALLKEKGLQHDVIGLFDFIEAGIRGREFAKFVFTRSLSDMLVLLGHVGGLHGFSRDDLSYMDIQSVYELYMGSGDIHGLLARQIEHGRKQHRLTRSLVLPPLLTSPEEVFSFTLPPNAPNFITHLRVQAEVRRASTPGDLQGTIVAIPSADPGFDWIFSHGILGFITAFGGVNSHMAIRAGELGIPAVIGAGEASFNLWASAKKLDIDCANRQVKVLR